MRSILITLWCTTLYVQHITGVSGGASPFTCSRQDKPKIVDNDYTKLIVIRTRTKRAARAFSRTAATAWNELPQCVKECKSSSVFRGQHWRENWTFQSVCWLGISIILYRFRFGRASVSAHRSEISGVLLYRNCYYYCSDFSTAKTWVILASILRKGGDENLYTTTNAVNVDIQSLHWIKVCIITLLIYLKFIF